MTQGSYPQLTIREKSIINLLIFVTVINNKKKGKKSILYLILNIEIEIDLLGS